LQERPGAAIAEKLFGLGALLTAADSAKDIPLNEDIVSFHNMVDF
jgi:hypothetical protein